MVEGMKTWHRLRGHQLGAASVLGVTHWTCSCGRRWLP